MKEATRKAVDIMINTKLVDRWNNVCKTECYQSFVFI